MEMDGTVPKWSIKEVNETLNVKGSDWRPSSAIPLLVPQLQGSFSCAVLPLTAASETSLVTCLYVIHTGKFVLCARKIFSP